MCRFYGPGPNSHFYSAEPSDCAVLNQPGTGWYPEGTAFWITRAQDPVCPAGTQAVMRLYNGRFRENDSNHRFTTSVSVLNDMKGQGWSVEGAVMCAPL